MPASIEFTAFTTSVNEDTQSNYGKYSQTALIVYLLPLWLMIRFCVCMEASHPSSTKLTLSKTSFDRLMYLTQAFSVTYFGQIPIKRSKSGVKMTEEFLLPLEKTS